MNVSPIESDFSWRNHQWNSWLYLPPRRWAFEHMKATKIILFLFLRERGSCRAWREGDIIWDWLTSEQLWGFYLNLRLNLLSRPFVGFKIQNCNFISCRLWNLWVKKTKLLWAEWWQETLPKAPKTKSLVSAILIFTIELVWSQTIYWQKQVPPVS